MGIVWYNMPAYTHLPMLTTPLNDEKGAATGKVALYPGLRVLAAGPADAEGGASH